MYIKLGGECVGLTYELCSTKVSREQHNFHASKSIRMIQKLLEK